MPERKKYPTSAFENALSPGLFPLCMMSFGLSYHHILTMSCLFAFFSLCSSLVLDVSLSPFPCVVFIVSTAVATSCHFLSFTAGRNLPCCLYFTCPVTNIGPFLLSCPLGNDSHGIIQKCLGFTGQWSLLGDVCPTCWTKRASYAYPGFLMEYIIHKSTETLNQPLTGWLTLWLQQWLLSVLGSCWLGYTFSKQNSWTNFPDHFHVLPCLPNDIVGADKAF